MPDWYPILRAARYLHMSPTELLALPAYWQHKALIAERVETDVEAEFQRRASES